MADKVVLYSNCRSSPSWRVRIVLATKGIKYEYKAVNLLPDGGDQHSEEFTKLNPMGQVPVLLIDGHCLIQSLPIIEYLEEKFHEPPLLPKDSFGRAQVRAIAEIMNSGIQPLHNLKVLQQVRDGKEAWEKSHIEYGLKALELLLGKTAGTYCYGDQVTLADVFLVPQVFAAKRFNVDITQYPIISRVNNVLTEIPAFKTADAFRQPDTPENLRLA